MKKLWNKFKHWFWWSKFGLGVWFWGHFYFLSFIQEFGNNPDYQDWIFGRLEVFYPRKIAREDGYQDEEIPFYTPKRYEFWKFREKYDFKHVTRNRFLKVKKIIEEKYQQNI